MEINKKVEILEKKSKDYWDILQIIGGLLMPVAIASVGWIYSNAMKEVEIQVLKEKSSFEKSISEANIKVYQAQLVATFLKSLLSDNNIEQKLAIQAVLIALPNQGPSLIKVLEGTDNTELIKKFATKSLASYKEKLILQFFSKKKLVRSNAYTSLQSSYGSDSSIILELIKMAKKNKDNLDATYNLLVLLSHMKQNIVRPYVTEINKFSYEVESNGPKTKKRAEKLRSRLPK